MALIKCSECGYDISTTAEFCPKCGCPMSEMIKPQKKEIAKENKSKITKKKLVIWIIVFLLTSSISLCGIIYLNNGFEISNGQSTSQPNKAKTIEPEPGRNADGSCIMNKTYDVRKIKIISECTKADNTAGGCGDIFDKPDEYEGKIIRNNSYGDIFSVNYKLYGFEDPQCMQAWYSVTLEDGTEAFVWGGYKVMYVKEYTKEPADMVKDALKSTGFVARNPNVYIYNFKTNGDIIYNEFNFNDKAFKTYSYGSGLELTVSYNYNTNIIEFYSEYDYYTTNIKWNLNTNRWNCNSRISGWCEDYAQEYVDGTMNDTYNMFNEILKTAGVDVDDIK